MTATEILAEAAIALGHDVKKTEVAGMAQRGGVVSNPLFASLLSSYKKSSQKSGNVIIPTYSVKMKTIRALLPRKLFNFIIKIMNCA